MYEIIIKKRASKKLGNLPTNDYPRIRDKIRALAENPRHQGCLKLRGRDGWWIIKLEF